MKQLLHVDAAFEKHYKSGEQLPSFDQTLQVSNVYLWRRNRYLQVLSFPSEPLHRDDFANAERV